LTLRAFAGTLARLLEQFRTCLSGREHADTTLLALLAVLEREAWPQMLQRAMHWLNFWRAPDVSTDDPNKVAKVTTRVLNHLWTTTSEEGLFSKVSTPTLASELLRSSVRPLLDFIESWFALDCLVWRGWCVLFFWLFFCILKSGFFLLDRTLQGLVVDPCDEFFLHESKLSSDRLVDDWLFKVQLRGFGDAQDAVARGLCPAFLEPHLTEVLPLTSAICVLAFTWVFLDSPGGKVCAGAQEP
jgi:hypothetical protein